MSFRAGTASMSGTDAPDAGYGAGVEFSRMLSMMRLYKWSLFKKTSLGASVTFENLGSFGDAKQAAIPATLQLTRHFRWSPVVHPYFGIGGGAYYRKVSNTGDDFSVVKPGFLLVFGVNLPIDDHQVLGLDVRTSFLDTGNSGVNPVFGDGNQNSPLWSVKLNYALTYFK